MSASRKKREPQGKKKSVMAPFMACCIFQLSKKKSLKRCGLNYEKRRYLLFVWELGVKFVE